MSLETRTIEYHKQPNQIQIETTLSHSNNGKCTTFHIVTQNKKSIGVLRAVNLMEQNKSWNSLSQTQKSVYNQQLSQQKRELTNSLNIMANLSLPNSSFLSPVKLDKNSLEQENSQYQSYHYIFPQTTYQFHEWKDINSFGLDLYIYQLESPDMTHITISPNSTLQVSLPQNNTTLKPTGNLMKVKSSGTYVFNTNVPKENIRQIIFSGSLKNIPSNAWDISEQQNKSVMAWIQQGMILYICSDKQVIANPDSSGLFSNYTNVTSISFGTYFDTSKVMDMSCMFSYCSSLTKLDLSRLDTKNVVDMSNMFEHCYKLTELNLKYFNTSNVTNMFGMFFACSSLQSLNLNYFDTRKVTRMGYMFGDCKNLTKLDLSRFDISHVSNTNEMFQNCATKYIIQNKKLQPVNGTFLGFSL